MLKTAAAVMAMRQFEAKRARHAPGFYRALHEWSTANLLESAISKAGRKHSRSALSIGNADSLPEGCYLLDRVVSKRKKQVRHFNKPIICITICEGSKAAMSLQGTCKINESAPPSQV